MDTDLKCSLFLRQISVPTLFLLLSPHSFQYPPNSSGHASILEGTSSLLQSNHRIVFVSKQKDISVATMDYLVSDAESTCMSLLSLTLMATLVSCHRSFIRYCVSS
jgi:hypothetical protein